VGSSSLPRASPFAQLPEEEIIRLASTVRRRNLGTGDVLFNEGDAGASVYVLLDGQIEIVKALGTADEHQLAVRGPGELFGEMSLLNPDHIRTASVRALESATLMEMTHADFDALIHRNPRFAYELARVLSNRLNEFNNAVIRDLQEKNRELVRAYADLKAAQAQIIEKEKLEHELQLAREIQYSILPRDLPTLPGFGFCALTQPALAVGGDFYDFIPLSDDRLGIAVGDISDKGVPAAIFMALTRSLLRVEASRGTPPAETLTSVNRYLLDMNEAGMFCTLLYGVLDGPGRVFHFARAGHEVPITFDHRGRAGQRIQGKGQLLGLLPEPELDVQTITLPDRGSLLLYSDGVTDAANFASEFFGLARLEAAVAAAPPSAAPALCNTVLSAVMTSQGAAAQFDDITLVAVHWPSE
jgi:phosphoserine phosphatase RsbU/P